MSSFLFLTFCVYVFRCLGLHFSEFILLGLSSGGFLLLLSKPPQEPHAGPTGLVWSFGGVVSPPGSQNRTQGRTGASLVFLPQNEFTPPPKGGGAGYRLSWVGRVCSARSQRGHSGPTGPVRGFPGVRSPTRLPKPHTAAHRGEFGFTAFSWCASFAAAQQTVVPGGNSPPPG